MTCLAIQLTTLVISIFPAPKVVHDPIQSGAQPGKRIQGIFQPMAVHYAANPELNGQLINPACHYGHNPTVMVFARDVGPELQKLVKRLDSEAVKLKGFRLGACVVLLTDDEPAAAEKKLRKLKDEAKIERVTLAYLDSAGPKGYNIAADAEWTVLLYKKYQVGANHALRKRELNDKAIDRVIADIDTIVPETLVWSGVIVAPGDSAALKIYIRRDRVEGPVTLKLTDLPKGIRAGELTIPAKESEGVLMITADKNAPLGQEPARGIVTTTKKRSEVPVSIWVRDPLP